MRHLIKLLIAMIIIFPKSGFSQEKDSAKTEPTKEKKETTGKEEDKKKESTVWNNLTYLIAANFNFNETVTGSYLGKLSILAPDIKRSPLGFCAGIMRTKFNYKDSSNSTYALENRLIHPLDSIKHGSKYLRQFNKYTTTRTNLTWSFYAQPLIRLVSWPSKKNTKKGKGNLAEPNGIYFHGHFELLVNKVNVTTNVTALQQDTALIDSTKHLSYINYQPNPLIYDRTFLNGYFGVGVTVNLDPFDNGNSRFFFQPTIGVTTNYPSWVSQDISSTGVNVQYNPDGKLIPGYRQVSSGWFYLVRAEFSQKLSNNSQIIIGTDIRGLLPNYSPVFAAYVGLNINLDALAGIFSDKDKNEKKEASGK